MNAFTMGASAFVNSFHTKKFNNLNQQEKIEYFLGAASATNVDVVFHLLDKSMITVTTYDPEFDIEYYTAIKNVMDTLQDAISEGDEDAILVYDRVSKYFRI